MREVHIDMSTNLDNERKDAMGARIAIVLVIVMIGVIAVFGFERFGGDDGSAADDTGDIGMIDTSDARPGNTAPDFRLENQDGESYKLSDFRGQAVFLNFWADWCSFCKEEMPDMQRVSDEYGDDLVVIGVNAGDPVDVGERFVESVGVTYLRLYDGDLEVTEGYNVQAMPTSYFISADGEIVDHSFGFLFHEQMVEKVEATISSN
ncbi:MAG: TlpA family protein disulfide reductase [Chloroflexota bacterium]